jgi:SAM-dependent methyltransferase
MTAALMPNLLVPNSLAPDSLVPNLYNDDTIGQWRHDKTMLHSSGIWGREPVLKYLREEVLSRGDVVIDLGAGAGYPSLQMSAMVGPSGRVLGIELSEAMVKAAREQCRADNLCFEPGDVSGALKVADATADVVTSFMVLHNLRLAQVRAALAEVERVLKPGGRAVFLTMHPDAFESYWELDFLSYDADALRRYRGARDKEDLEIPGRARNAAGGENLIVTLYHSRASLLRCAEDVGLVLADEQDLWIDADKAGTLFGAETIRILPTTPIYWMLALRKRRLAGEVVADILARTTSTQPVSGSE